MAHGDPPAAASPVRPRRQRERSALSDRLMVTAAIQTLVEKGVVGTTIAEVARRAGYSHALIVQRYGGKAGLLARVAAVMTEDWRAVLRRKVGERSGIEALLAVVDAHIEFLTEQPHENRALHLLRFHAIDPSAEYRADIVALHRAQTRATQAWIEAGIAAGSIRADVDAALEAKKFLAIMGGFVYHWMVDPAFPIAAMHERLKEELSADLLADRPAARHSPKK